MCRTSFVKRRESRMGKRSRRASSDGSDVQPSIGMPFAVIFGMSWETKREVGLTLIDGVAYGRVVDETYAC